MKNNTSFEKGVQLLKSERFEDAIVIFTQLIGSDRNNAKFYCERGVTYMHLKRFDKAISDMDKAAELEPKNGYRFASRAFVKGAAGDVIGGIKDYEKAIELNPEDDISYNNLGLLQERLGYEKQSKRNFKEADNLSNVDSEFSKRLNTNGTNSLGNSQILNTSTAPKVDLVNAAKKQKTNETSWGIIKSVFTSKRGLAEFVDFVKSGFKITE